MECTDAPGVCNAKQSDDHFNVEFRWQCKPEFSTDKMDDVNKVLTSVMQVEQNSLSFSRVSEDLQGSHSVCLATPVEIR